MRFQSEPFVFKFLWRSVDGGYVFCLLDSDWIRIGFGLDSDWIRIGFGLDSDWILLDVFGKDWPRFPVTGTCLSSSSRCYCLSSYKRTLHPAAWAMDVIFLRYSCICSGLRSSMNLKTNAIHNITCYRNTILDCNDSSLHTYLVVSTMTTASSANISFTSGVNKWTILQKIFSAR